MTQENQTHVKDTAKNVMARNNPLAQGRQLALWIGALIFGAVLGWMNVPFLNQLFNFIATVFTRLFQFIAVPTIALAVITTLSMMGSKEETKRIFKHTITYTLLTTICAAGIGLLLYLWIQPGNLPTEAIGALLKVLPIGILAFAAQLSSQLEAGVIVGALGRYTLVIMAGNLTQFFIVLPLFLLIRGLNPVRVMKAMSPALAVALFTKSSAATLPVTMASAEENMRINPSISRFVLPICTTINMNGCAAFILVTSIFLMQNGGMELSFGTMIVWLFISVFAAIGNAGVPMGCYFLTLSLMSGVGAPIGIMGIILPIYTIIDMIETCENVWSDSCVCSMTQNDLKDEIPFTVEIEA